MRDGRGDPVTQAVGTAAAVLGVIVAVSASASSVLVGGVAMISIVSGDRRRDLRDEAKFGAASRERGASAAWKEERDAEKAKVERLDLEILRERGRRAAAGGEPDRHSPPREAICADNHSDVRRPAEEARRHPAREHDGR
jgi:hypothetical protein